MNSHTFNIPETKKGGSWGEALSPSPSFAWIPGYTRAVMYTCLTSDHHLLELTSVCMTVCVVQVAEAINYLHSKHFVYRDLKPGNILVFKFPEPDTQWNSNTKILVKVADYGISKQVSPEGLRGGSGTPPYLPPEVNLTGGREAASTMIDVYAFGMFIYYLMTFMTPFEMEVRPLNSLLEEGRRPELPPKVWLS